jgi:phosphoribosyl-ATP pyrophosphohydrolase/phosphoribosyl-AMP cyclohydrolase
MKIETPAQLDDIDFGRTGGIVPVVTQHARTGEILMLAWANRNALERTLAERRMWYWSRSRERLWLKGESSGNAQALVALHHDCDFDAILALVHPSGPSCHSGDWSCFGAAPVLPAPAAVIADRTHGGGAYTGRLLADENLRLKKLGEESVELALACGRGDADGAAAEAADLLYHTLVACAATGVTLDDVLAVLESRRASAARPADQDAVDPQ